MRHGRKMLGCVLGCIVSATSADAVTADNPFQGIVDRNVFGLKAPPPPPEAPPPPKPPLPPFSLTGIMTMGGRKRALLEGVLPAKPPDQPKKSFYTLGEDEREGEVHVLKIDEKAGSVQVDLFGTVTNMTFGAKLPPASPAGGPPGAPPGQPPPGFPSPVNTGINPAFTPGQRTLPGRPLRTNPTEGAVNPAAGSPGTANAAYGQPQANAQSAGPQLSRDESALIIEAERERLKQNNDPLANLMPVTHLTPAGAPGTGVTTDTGQEGTTPTPTPTIRRRTSPLPQ